ncbi:macro domain-containing protein [Aestuariispira insulae]|uniref:O-acetyl-ADP-ribose deacetylase (Regulator of RNase III) n=1 Tax=Aestuariispira insulae TaxID=1461337 RepID=A0A3D9HF34_9PROT|nr:macro domain-containing protein [Aestuariispira insulae]RED48088.1 O-acetyl-ADP-ribose deacetylase (regulator of RNase III) [Aestuariispira insulae]
MVESAIKLVRANIATLDVDAIVNAANKSLLGGGGVDGVIHAAAGPGLKEECRAFGGCPTGEVRITSGHSLKARHVIHAVGPVWKGGGDGEEDLLAQTYRNILKAASDYGLGRVAIPAISTGAYCFPVELAIGIAVREIRAGLEQADQPMEIIFCCFDRKTVKIYEKALGMVAQET